jgi:hypothetical protein
VNGTTKAVLAYLWPAGDDGDAVAGDAVAGDAVAGDAFAGADVLAALLQPAITSRVSALREAAAASR